jgi:hypothetical protein
MQQKRVEGDREDDMILLELEIDYTFFCFFWEKKFCFWKKIFKKLQSFAWLFYSRFIDINLINNPKFSRIGINKFNSFGLFLN